MFELDSFLIVAMARRLPQANFVLIAPPLYDKSIAAGL
jgi:hypothetical protein